MSDLQEVQQRVGVTPAPTWTPTLGSALAAYQLQHGLAVTGTPDPATMTELALYDPVAGAPRSFKQYLRGGDEPGHFGRDFSGATSQVPWWAYGLVGAAFGGLAYLSYRRRGGTK